jgi:hypothetical protein
MDRLPVLARSTYRLFFRPIAHTLHFGSGEEKGSEFKTAHQTSARHEHPAN